MQFLPSSALQFPYSSRQVTAIVNTDNPSSPSTLETHHANAPLWFNRMYKMVITGENYIVPISFSPQTLITNIDTTLTYINTVNNTIFKDLDNGMHYGTMSNNDRVTAIDQFKMHNSMKLERIHSEFQKIKRSATDFITNRLGPINPRHARNKRGVLNFVGEISNILFGTSTEREIDEIHNAIKNQENFNQITLNRINLHSSILNETISDLASLHNIANKTTIALKALELAQQEANNINFKIQILLSILTELEINLNIVRNDYQNLINGISEFLTSYPSTHIIPDSLFTELLTAAAQKGNGLLFPQQQSNVGLFRETSAISSRHLNNEVIIFFLTIPLASHTYGAFNVYEVNSVPISLFNSTQFIEYIPDAKFLAVSDDTDRFQQFNDFSNCIRHVNTLICHPRTPIMNSKASNCIYNIFTFKGNNTCTKIITQKFTPRFIRVKDGFIYATDTPLVLRAQCGSERRIMKIKDSGFLNLDDNCHVAADTFSIPSHTSMHANEIQIPIMESQFSYVITSLKPFYSQPDISEILQSMNTEMPVSLTTAVSHLSLLKNQELQHMKLSSWDSLDAYKTPASVFSMGTLSIIMIIVIITFCIYFRNPIFRALKTINSHMSAPKGLGASKEEPLVADENLQQAIELLLNPN